jgi:hypothetical protein
MPLLPRQRALVHLPHEPAAVLGAWQSVQAAMVRSRPDAFDRAEWAYLMTFLDAHALASVFDEAFGPAVPEGAAPPRLRRPRGDIGLWLPNNVSLLGPLVLVLLSLIGAKLRVKGGSRGDDLCGAWLDWLRGHVPDGPLCDWLERQVDFAVFSSADPRSEEMSAASATRIAFGSDEALRAIEALPHPLGSVFVPFGHRVSEAWISPARIAEDAVVDDLIRVFAIYGQAGCTSPSRVVVLDGTPADARRLRDRVVERWAAVLPAPPPPHVASRSLMEFQLARAAGRDPAFAPCRAAVCSSPGIPPVPGGKPAALERFFSPGTGELRGELPIFAEAVSEALLRLPPNTQTLGLAVGEAYREALRPYLVSAPCKRVVPIAAMHHFGPVWDGVAFWDACFEEIDLRGCQ